jgi:hypothetical protein
VGAGHAESKCDLGVGEVALVGELADAVGAKEVAGGHGVLVVM